MTDSTFTKTPKVSFFPESFYQIPSSNHQPQSNPQQGFNHPQRIAFLTLGMAVLTLFLMALGSATRVMNAGLSCPDWPLCYGALIPTQQMNLQVFLEWFHRLVASSLGLFALLLTGLSWLWRKYLPTWVPVAASFSLCLIGVQAVLGGLTVTQLLRFDVVSAHLATGLLFFVTLLTIGMMLLPYQGTGAVRSLTWLGLGAVGLVYVQSLLGVLVASQWAVHQCMGASRLCGVLHNHLFGVIPASLSVLVLAGLAWRRAALHPWLRRCSQMGLALLAVQVLLGVLTLRLKLQIPAITVAHQVVGAMLLGCLVAFSVLALRDRFQTQIQVQQDPLLSGL
jgi:heme a synthase